jgi:tungstate transport system ATP-binding protein
MSPPAPLLSTQKLCVTLGRVHALNGVDFALAAGECVALIGPNGAGKSSLLRALHGRLAPSSGQVFRREGAAVSMVFQRPYFIRTTALRNVAITAWLVGAPWRAALERAHVALSQVGLAAQGLRQARSLSGGEQQLLALARALVVPCDALLLDEPTASLAPAARQAVRAVLQACQARGMAILLASHNPADVREMTGRVVAMDAGSIVFDGPTVGYFAREFGE